MPRRQSDKQILNTLGRLADLVRLEPRLTPAAEKQMLRLIGTLRGSLISSVERIEAARRRIRGKA